MKKTLLLIVVLANMANNLNGMAQNEQKSKEESEAIIENQNRTILDQKEAIEKKEQENKLLRVELKDQLEMFEKTKENQATNNLFLFLTQKEAIEKKVQENKLLRAELKDQLEMFEKTKNDPAANKLFLLLASIKTSNL